MYDFVLNFELTYLQLALFVPMPFLITLKTWLIKRAMMTVERGMDTEAAKHSTVLYCCKIPEMKSNHFIAF